MNLKLPIDEKQLLSAIAAGDRRSFGLLFRANHLQVLSFARRLLRSEDRAMEVLQDVFLKLWLHREKLAGVENFGGYLNRVVRNECLKALRDLNREMRRDEAYQLDRADYTNVTEQEIDYREAEGILGRAVETLSVRQRAVYELCHRQGLSYAQAAEQLGLSPQTVHAYMKEALRKIRLHFRGHAIGYLAFMACLFK